MTILIIRAFILYVIVIFSVRFMGKRQIGQMQPTELVITILISNIATMTLEDPDAPLLTGTVPILFLVSVDVIISVFTMLSPEVEFAVVETNGQISAYQKEPYRNAEKRDIKELKK